MADPTYIEGPELRKWVKQHLSRKLFQTAHELALQTKCEVLIKIKDSQNVQDSYYYATEALERDFCNGGLQREQWDTDVTTAANEFSFSIPNTDSDPIPLKIESTASLTNSSADVTHDTVAGGSDSSGQIDDKEDDGEQPSARRHPFGIIPRKQQNSATPQRAPNQETNSITVQNVSPVVSASQQQVVHTSQPSIQITQQNPNRAVVQVVPTPMVPQVNQVRTINAQGTTIQLAGGNAAPPTVVPVQQLNQLKQGQVFIMQKVGNTQMLTPVTLQQGQGATPAPNVVSPTPKTEKEQQRTQNRLCIRPARNDSPGTSTGGFSGRPFKCGVCYKTFGSVQVLSRHSQTFHELVPNKRFFCDLCGKNYKHPQHLQQHMATHNSTAPYKCSQCHRGFYRMGTLKDHELLHLGMYRYYCPECRKGFMRPSLLQEHINRFHTATVTPSAPLENTNVVPANVVPTNVMYVQQPVAQEAKEESDDLQQDDGDDPADANPPTDANSDGNENGTHDNSQDLTDNLNGITIKQERLSPTEMDQGDANEDEEAKNQDSTEDNQSDQAGSALQAGAEGTSILGQLPTMVPISSASAQPLSSPQGNLIKIMPKLEGYTPLKIMPKLEGYTPVKTYAQGAAATGSGRPPRRYSCDICGKTYKYVFHMREHRLTHSGQHPFVCKICNTGFFRQRQLREHQFRHSGSFPVTCDKCSKGFFRPSELRRHQSVKHGIVVSGGDE